MVGANVQKDKSELTFMNAEWKPVENSVVIRVKEEEVYL